MRELKFRVWDKKEAEWLALGATGIDCLNGELVDYYYEGETKANQENYIIEQYTGIKDKNSKEIYEGDIVSEEFEYGGEKTKTIWQVRWCDDECAFELHYVSGFEVDDCSLVADDEENCEVIGNIHENPELLEQE